MKEANRYVIYARGHKPPDVHPRSYVPVMTDPAYAHAWLEFFLEGEEYRREGDTLHLDSGIRVKSEQLDAILNTPPVLELREDDNRRILRFKYGSWDESRAKPPPKNNGVETTRRIERERRPERPPGYVTITDLCAGSGVLPMIARAALRASGREKPAYGWAFDPKDVPAIKLICGIK
jgi:hypothetical protein